MYTHMYFQSQALKRRLKSMTLDLLVPAETLVWSLVDVGGDSVFRAVSVERENG